MNSSTFDFRRFSLLLRKELWSGNKKPLIVAGAVFGFLTVLAMYLIYTQDGYEHLNFNIFPMVLLGGGFIFTSISFYEFNDKTGTHHYLSLPASTLEKFLSKWLISAVLFPIVAVLLFWLYAKLGDAIYNRFEETDISTWSLTNWWSLFYIRLYFVAQSIFLAGAIAFEKYTLFKTALTLFLALLLFAAISAGSFRILYNEFFESMFETKNMMIDTTEETKGFMSTTFQDSVEYALWLVLPLIMWTVGFLKLKEKEA